MPSLRALRGLLRYVRYVRYDTMSGDGIEGTGLGGKGWERERVMNVQKRRYRYENDFGIILNVHFDAIRTWVIDFSTKAMNEF